MPRDVFAKVEYAGLCCVVRRAHEHARQGERYEPCGAAFPEKTPRKGIDCLRESAPLGHLPVAAQSEDSRRCGTDDRQVRQLRDGGQPPEHGVIHGVEGEVRKER
ncbi:hypothetical protein D3C83_18050 [compost metagenome]